MLRRALLVLLAGLLFSCKGGLQYGFYRVEKLRSSQTVSTYLTFFSSGIYRIQAFSSDTVADTVHVLP